MFYSLLRVICLFSEQGDGLLRLSVLCASVFTTAVGSDSRSVECEGWEDCACRSPSQQDDYGPELNLASASTDLRVANGPATGTYGSVVVLTPDQWDNMWMLVNIIDDNVQLRLPIEWKKQIDINSGQ